MTTLGILRPICSHHISLLALSPLKWTSRLIVVAEKHMVYDKFPIPLINRLEKHFLTVNNIMTPEQLEVASQLVQWAADFVKTTPRMPVHHMARQG